jgi:hypothetical protein
MPGKIDELMEARSREKSFQDVLNLIKLGNLQYALQAKKIAEFNMYNKDLIRNAFKEGVPSRYNLLIESIKLGNLGCEGEAREIAGKYSKLVDGGLIDVALGEGAQTNYKKQCEKMENYKETTPKKTPGEYSPNPRQAKEAEYKLKKEEARRKKLERFEEYMQR